MFSLVPQVLSFMQTKETSKNVAETTFKVARTYNESPGMHCSSQYKTATRYRQHAVWVHAWSHYH